MGSMYGVSNTMVESGASQTLNRNLNRLALMVYVYSSTSVPSG